jgi:hypothetical protein
MTDPENSRRKMFYLDQPELGLSREYLLLGLQEKEVQVSRCQGQPIW